MEINIQPQIDKTSPDVKVYNREGTQINVKSISVNSLGAFTEVVDTDNNVYDTSEVTLFKNFLEVPGIGFIKDGSIVRIDHALYVVKFGWHTNVSNQTIYSWYLRATRTELPASADSYTCSSILADRTLYQSMIDQIEEVIV